MLDTSAHRRTFDGLAICILTVLLGCPLARAQQPPSEPAAAGEEPGQSLVLGFVKAGATIGWDMGGVASAGVLIGGPTARLHIAARAMGGMSVDHSDPALAGGGEIGYRGIWRVHPKFRLTWLVAASYMYRRARTVQTDTVYLYHIPQGHLYVGLMFGNHPRISHGVEVGGSAGYAVHINPAAGATDYSGLYGGAELSYVLTF